MTKLSATTEYVIWRNMMWRCFRTSNQAFHNYGGRGITVCRRWRKFQNFLTDMGSRPPGLMLERKNNNGSYSPRNCKWADRFEQANNRRGNIKVSHRGLCLSIAQWGRRIGLSDKTLYTRLSRGWSVKRTITEPKHWRGIAGLKESGALAPEEKP